MRTGSGGDRRTTRSLAAFLACELLLSGCAGQRVDRLAERYELEQHLTQGAGFTHRVFQKAGSGPLLHVYLEGDGRPWLTPRRVAPDPTPDDPLMLRLMTLDSAPGVFVGRPCYFATSDPRCSARWWTTERYAPAVVDSLDAVLDRVAAPYRGIVLIGHSGGGALAMLLAARRHDVRAVVTLAGNLDIGAWARHHGHSELSGSLNPAEQPGLMPTIRQIHYLGSADTVVTEAMLRPVIAHQHNARLVIEPELDHSCCWDDIWPTILERLAMELNQTGQ